MSGTRDRPAGSMAEDAMELLDERDRGSELMIAWQRGDERAFDRLVESHSGRLYRLFTRFLGPVAGREDLVQEVFLRLIRTRERYLPTARFSTYLYRIAFNLSSHERERAALRLAKPLDGERAGREPEDEQVGQPSAGLERDDVVCAVQSAIAALPREQRMALVLSKYDGLAHEEIAQVLGSTAKAVKSLVHRARENLRVSLAGFLREETA